MMLLNKLFEHNLCKLLHLQRRAIFSKSFMAPTDEDKNILLNTISKSSDDELLNYGLSHQIVSKLKFEKSLCENGIFTSIEELNFGGLNSTRLSVLNSIIKGTHFPCKVLQNMIASSMENNKFSEPDMAFAASSSLPENEFPPNETTKKNNKKLDSSSMFKDLFIGSDPIQLAWSIKNSRSLTAVNISLVDVAWTVMSSNGEILDMSCLYNDSNEKNFKSFTSHELYEKVIVALKKVPESEVVVVEFPFMRFQITNNPRLNSLLEGIILSYFDRRNSLKEPHPLIFFKSSVVNKLFDLMIGQDRKSTLGIGEAILAGKPRSYTWLNPVSFTSKPLEKFILSTIDEKRAMVNALLLAITINHILIKERAVPTKQSHVSRG